jgi:DNA-dependent RNA polymerase auxiliary subunit epsilon
MDIQKYQKDREQDLAVFEREYDNLKSQYSSYLTQAVHETDTKKQAELVKQILSVNSSLAQHVREFISTSNGKFNKELITKLTEDIIRYQQEYQQIQNASNKTSTLEGIRNKQKNDLNALYTKFDMWLYVLLGLIAVVILLLLRTTIVQTTQAVQSLTSSTSSSDLGSMTPEPGASSDMTFPQ